MLCQLDICSKPDDGFTIGEAKDYSLQGKKVGRRDLQKLGEALLNLKEVYAGAFLGY